MQILADRHLENPLDKYEKRGLNDYVIFASKRVFKISYNKIYAKLPQSNTIICSQHFVEIHLLNICSP